MFSHDYLPAISVGLIAGFLARFYMLKVDYRHYPSYPHGYAAHLAFGFIGAALGAVAIPALLAEDYVAVTFLALAAQQFREIRSIERESLAKTEETEMVPRGAGYIEGIAKLFEARNYLAMGIGLLTTGGYLLGGLLLAVPTGILSAFIMNKAMIGPKVGSMAEVRQEDLLFEGPNIRVGDEIIMNVGEKMALDIWQEKGIALAVEPYDDNGRTTLGNAGQRQAILHDVASQLGVRLDIGEQHFTPLMRIELSSGRILMIVIPFEPDVEPLIEAIKKTPVLEAAMRKPLETSVGRTASD